MIILTNLFIPDRFAAYTIWPFILIRPEYRDNEGLKAHEEVHWNQTWTTCFLHGLLYKFSKKYRLKAEVEAYREQLTYPNGNAEQFAEFLATRYDLGITKEEALLLLTKEQ